VDVVVRQGVLRADVFAAAALESEFHGNFRRTMLVKMKRRRARPDVRAVILAGQRINRILPEKTFLRRQRHRFARRLGERHLVVADRNIHEKQNAAGVLADRLRLGFRERDVLVNDLEGVGREGLFLLVLQRGENRAVDVIRNPADVRRMSSTRESRSWLISFLQRKTSRGMRQLPADGISGTTRFNQQDHEGTIVQAGGGTSNSAMAASNTSMSNGFWSVRSPPELWRRAAHPWR